MPSHGEEPLNPIAEPYWLGARPDAGPPHLLDANQSSRGASKELTARRCRLLAEEAQKLADNSAGLMQEGYLEIAADWLKLVEEIERAAG